MDKRKRQPFDYYLVLDFEATCEKDAQNYPNEIIEFPVHILPANPIETLEDNLPRSFHTYVRPTENMTLTPFCTKLTGITQEQVDDSPTLPEVLEQLDNWLKTNKFVTKETQDHFTFAWLTDGPWDLRNFLYTECTRKGIKRPDYFDSWVNVRWLFSECYSTKRRNIRGMLSQFGMTFEGKLHAGYDDAYNIARIANKMMDDGFVLKMNDSLAKPADGNRDYSYKPYKGLNNPGAKKTEKKTG